LSRYVDGTSGTNAGYASTTAGKLLKNTSGWSNGNGTNQYGFSALPGGLGGRRIIKKKIGYYGYWWSASEFEDLSYGAYRRYMGYDDDGASWYYDNKASLFSVRCVQD
jgi:uncharacterized protein (TIGR02145 family)